MKKRLFAMLLAAVMVMALLPTAFAADGAAISVTVTKTNIKADRVVNYNGYGSLRINGNWDNAKYKNWFWVNDNPPAGLINPQVALVDRSGKLIFPYRENTDIYQRTLEYAYYEGVVSLTYTDYDGVYMSDGFAEYYLIDGTKISGKTYIGGGIMREGYAVVVDKGTGSINGYAGEPVYKILDKNGKLNELPEGFSTIIGIGGMYNYGTQLSLLNARCGEGLFAFYDNWKGEGGGYIDTTGKTVIDLEGLGYQNLGPFSEGLAGIVDDVDENFKVGYIDKTGKVVIPCTYRSGGMFSNGLARVETMDGKWGYIDKTGKVVVPCIYDSVRMFPDNGLAYVEKDGKSGYIDATGTVVIPLEYDGANGASDGLAAVGKNGKYGLVDYSNNVVVPLEYDDISSFVGGVAYAVKDGYLYIITEEGAEPPPSFNDVPEGEWYAPAVAWAAGLGYVNGVGGGRFAPLSTCTHEQILTMLWRAAGEIGAASSPFVVDSAYQGAVDWAYEQGMIDDSFNAKDPCTRASALKYIWMALGRQSGAASSFDDVSPDADYAAAVDWAVEIGITEGTGNNQFTPDKVCNRGTIATFLYRAYANSR